MQFVNLADFNLPHGMFMRHGGVSPTPFNSLNLGGNNGDAKPNVVENRKRIFEAVGRPVDSLYDVWQVHSDTIVCTHQPRPLEAEHLAADAILTDSPAVTLFMRFADCVPIYVFDPERSVVGLIHAGWPGTVKQLVLKTVQKMQEVYGSVPEHILAGIGPSICVEHYEIQEDVIRQVHSGFGVEAEQFLWRHNGSTFFNLQEANRHQLAQAGVRQIEISGVCTACHTDDWFSHRGDHGSTGRYGALLAL
ncbi:MAG: peptidoglycan editing factor PgeF [Anaerolineaceae bacterium]